MSSEQQLTHYKPVKVSTGGQTGEGEAERDLNMFTGDAQLFATWGRHSKTCYMQVEALTCLKSSQFWGKEIILMSLPLTKPH